jgi:hypothetical protein
MVSIGRVSTCMGVLQSAVGKRQFKKQFDVGLFWPKLAS